MGLTIVGLTGEIGGKMSQICDTINIPTMITEKIQECHIMVGHIVCAQIENIISMNCYLCNCENFKIVNNGTRDKANISVIKCTNCGQLHSILSSI